MVRRADRVLALWDWVKKGGTYLTVRTAEDMHTEVVNVWPEWTCYHGMEIKGIK
jgi:hypothetical protein